MLTSPLAPSLPPTSSEALPDSRRRIICVLWYAVVHPAAEGHRISNSPIVHRTQQLNSLHEIQVILSDDHVRELISRLEALPTPPPESSDSSSEDGHDVDSGDGHDVNSNDADDDTESEEG
jgi:hypothetical protein